MKLTVALAKIFRSFVEHHIDALVMKGPALAQMLYGNVSMRASKDLDILVRKEQIVQAVEILEGIGYSWFAVHSVYGSL